VNEVFDVVTRAYEYQRVRPAVFGRTSDLETVQPTLEGKLPTPSIIATLGISLVEAAEGRAAFEGSPAEWQYKQRAPVQRRMAPRYSTRPSGTRSKARCPQVEASPPSICMFGSCAP
jgi:hypothetical protein